MPLEHPEVRMPPPLLHLGGLLVGYGLDFGTARTLVQRGAVLVAA